MTISETTPAPPDPVTARLLCMFRAFEWGWRDALSEPTRPCIQRVREAVLAAHELGVSVSVERIEAWRSVGRERRLAELAGPLATDDPPPRDTQRYSWWVEAVLGDPNAVTVERILSWGPQVAWDVMIKAATRSGVLDAQIEMGLGGNAEQARVDALVEAIMQVGWPPHGIPDYWGAAAVLGASERARAVGLDELGGVL